jgi:branched-chain amino acid transport system ATP-binding protein
MHDARAPGYPTADIAAIAPEIVLETRDLVKEFEGFVAVDGVSLRVRCGEIHALIGPNGAGKTTLFNLLTKFLQPTSGSIFFRGENITREAPADIARRGVVRSFQISAVFPHLTVLENVRVALQSKLGTSFHFWRSGKGLAALDDRAMQLLTEVGLGDSAPKLTADLAYGSKRALELATTLALDPQLLLLDEPTQGMGHEDVARVTRLIREVSLGRTVLMVEHNMRVVSTIADTISVLQRGRLIAAGAYAQVSKDPQVVEAYMGSSSAALSGVG